jgi:hypothetical protein
MKDQRNKVSTDSCASTNRTHSSNLADLELRDPKFKAADLSCVRAIAQAAINVELFTIPLYMTSLYSVYGMHQINSKGSDLYEGRWWPGCGAASGYIPQNRLGPNTVDLKSVLNTSLTTNAQVFNNVYSVFIEEMLHLQLASNMASKINVTPSFTSAELQSDTYGWQCYDKQSVLPHILDFKDCTADLSKLNVDIQRYFATHFPGQSLQDMKVELSTLDKKQALLFLIIEETEDDAKKIIRDEFLKKLPGCDQPKYFEDAPFDWFKADCNESDLPMFGSIGHMYLCYWDYLEITYEDGSTLFDELTTTGQRDYFNTKGGGDEPQYPGIDGTLNPSMDALKLKFINNINAITDQGEGKGVVEDICNKYSNKSWVNTFRSQQQVQKQAANTVDPVFQPSEAGLRDDYKGYDDAGNEITMSGVACARITNKARDHYEIFKETLDLIVQYSDKTEQPDEHYLTWDRWHEQDNHWCKSMLKPGDLKDNYPALPKAEDVAQALNKLNEADQTQQSHTLFSQSAVGTLKGLTMALDRYWSGESNEFPGPAMGGSGDRVSICWAVTGKVPNLVDGIDNQDSAVLYNACQGMTYMNGPVNPDELPSPVVYHSCKGSNECKAQGGCGFVQSADGGGSCSQFAATGIKSAPADNLCGTLGGCAVPISASQLFPHKDQEQREMQLYKFDSTSPYKATKISYPPVIDDMAENQPEADEDGCVPMPYEAGDSVYHIAWRAYCVAKGKLTPQNIKPVCATTPQPDLIVYTYPEAPHDNDIRLALPPST